MLCITRKSGQSFTIGPDVTVRILETDGGQVRVGIDAPKHIKILRDDAKVKAEKK